MQPSAVEITIQCNNYDSQSPTVSYSITNTNMKIIIQKEH